MKSYFKTILIFILLNTNIEARTGVLISYKDQVDQGHLVRKILTNQFHFPDIIINEQSGIAECKININVIIQICIDTQNEINIFINDSNFFKSNFREFIKTGEL
jgi:hypothetical protein